HEGEMVFEGNDVLGDGVNIASRLQEDTVAGCIMISGSVYRDIKNKAGIKTEFIGEKLFKNVDDLIKIYNVIYDATAIKNISDPQKDHRAEPSIAVLPFVNMSNDPEQEYFCDGISEEIINALTHIERLKVIARTSSFAFKGKNEDMREIGKKLDVGTLLEGSVRKAGKRLRITAQLIKVSDGSHLWSERYDREMKDVFEIQDEISMGIVDKLKIQLFKQEKEKLLKNNTENVEAYKLYLKGQFEWYKRSEESMNKSIDYFQEALKIDSRYTLASTGIADAYIALTDWGGLLTTVSLPKARDLLNKALKIDNNVAEIYFSLAYIDLCSWNPKGVEQNFQNTIRLNPNLAKAHHLYGLSNALLGDFDKALYHNALARELDPLSMIFNFSYGLILYFSHQIDHALIQFRKTQSFDNSFLPAILWSTYCYILMEKPKEAVREFQKIVLQDSNSSELISEVKNIYEASGIKGFLSWMIKKGLNQYKRKHNLHYHKAICFALLNKKDEAFECLTEGFEQKSVRMTFIKFEPGLNNIKSDPRFKSLTDKIGLW
ncbi:MAG: hypothetical protein KAQ79_08010, partial [Cyclobacteriaceae bacterium]|nr:hypothetical protein [Cyclobacteriaceae bacterium]